MYKVHTREHFVFPEAYFRCLPTAGIHLECRRLNFCRFDRAKNVDAQLMDASCRRVSNDIRILHVLVGIVCTHRIPWYFPFTCARSWIFVILTAIQQSHISMSVHRCRLMLLAVLSVALLSNCFTIGGPARSFALVAGRAAKIPRSIRAPFTNPQMKTSRGFGKRSQPGGELSWFVLHSVEDLGGCDSIDEHELFLIVCEPVDGSWNFNGPNDSKFYNDLVADGDTLNDILNESSSSSASERYVIACFHGYFPEISRLKLTFRELLSTIFSIELSFPVEWLANELSHNPTVIEAILRRFVDVNRDGVLTSAEMLQQRPTTANNAGANGPATHQATLSGDLTDVY